MNNSILVVYKSTTGFTKRYAELIGEELKCKVLSFENISANIINEYDIVIFGSRVVAGHLDDITRMLKLIQTSSVRHFIVFATGASPIGTKAVEAMWEASLTKEQLHKYPHFYFPAGLNYEEMTFGDRAMLTALKFYLKLKPKKTDNDRELEKMLEHSYDISDDSYVKELINNIDKA